MKAEAEPLVEIAAQLLTLDAPGKANEAEERLGIYPMDP